MLDEIRVRFLLVYDFFEVLVYVILFVFRFICKEVEVVEEEVILVIKMDDSIVVVEFKVYVLIYVLIWVFNSMCFRWEKLGIYELEELYRYWKYLEEFYGLCVWVYDCMFYYMDLIIKIDILFVIGVDKCFYRKYE